MVSIVPLMFPPQMWKQRDESGNTSQLIYHIKNCMQTQRLKRWTSSSGKLSAFTKISQGICSIEKERQQGYFKDSKDGIVGPNEDSIVTTSERAIRVDKYLIDTRISCHGVLYTKDPLGIFFM